MSGFGLNFRPLRLRAAGPALAPGVTTPSPSSFASGASVTFTGSNYADGAQLDLAGTLVATTFVSSTQLTVASMPTRSPGLTTAYIRNPDGQYSPPFGVTYTESLIDLSLRTASLYLIADDYLVGSPDRLLGRDSAGTSGDANYRRDQFTSATGDTGGAVNPTTVTVGGKKWLVDGGNSHGVISSDAGSVLTTANIFGPPAGPWSITTAFSIASLSGTAGSHSTSVLGGQQYGVQVAALADGRLGVAALNAAASSYQFTGMPAGTIVANERCILQTQFDGTNVRFRKRSGGVTGSWTAPVAMNIHAAAGTMCLLNGSVAGAEFTGEFGGAYIEKQYASDMDDVLASFTPKVGLT